MHSSNRSNNQEGRSFIENARRAQIIQATIQVLATHGYANTSFVRIGEQAGITPSLIAYHFKNKDDLTSETLRAILLERAAYIDARLRHVPTATEKLRIAIEADLDNMSAHIENFKALTEIVFNLRSDQGTLTYLGEREAELFNLIYTILTEGVQSGEFNTIDAQNVAIIINGARDTFLAQLGLRPNFDVASFKKTLTAIALSAVGKEQ